MSFQQALDSVGNGIRDLSELNVRTFTGTVSGQINANMSAKDIMNQAMQAGELKVVAITNMMLDGDVDQFISNDAAAVGLLAAHSSAVDAGQRSRKAALDLLASAVQKAIAKL